MLKKGIFTALDKMSAKQDFDEEEMGNIENFNK